MQCLLVFLLVLASSANSLPSIPSAGTRIRGGEETSIERHPHQVSLELKGGGGGLQCGGSILSARHVLTAAHCVDYYKDYLVVRAGTTYRERGGSLHTIQAILRHENFTYNEYDLPVNDLALLRVSPDFRIDKTRRAIELTKEPVAPGRMAVVTGWGDTGNGSLARQLQRLRVPVISKTSCDSALREFGGLGEGQMCTRYEGAGKKDACNGDSGGPLTVDGRLVGIVSYGDECRLLDYPGMYTEIAFYYGWIQKHRHI